jgi:hypothetical protein
LTADKPADASVEFLCDVLRQILAECVGVGVPLGISCESVSIFKSEIDGCHTLFRKWQARMLDTGGSPWKIQWVQVMPPAGRALAGDDSAEEENALVAFDNVTQEYVLVVVGWLMFTKDKSKAEKETALSKMGLPKEMTGQKIQLRDTEHSERFLYKYVHPGSVAIDEFGSQSY